MTTTDAPAGPTFSIAEVVDRTGVSADSLRYYERIGLLGVERDAAGRRRYGERDVGRVVFINRLRSADLPIRALQHYFSLVAEGPHTDGARRALLEAHRESLRERVAQLEAALALIEHKIERYGGTLDACQPEALTR